MQSINLFLDNILKINNLFKTLLQKYFENQFNDVQKVTDQISDLESECDALRRDVERKIYSETLIPEIREDILECWRTWIKYLVKYKEMRIVSILKNLKSIHRVK